MNTLEVTYKPEDEMPYNKYKDKVPPTLRRFHACRAKHRCIVGPVGSAKTSAAVMEVGDYLPGFLLEEYGIKKTRWVVLRNSYRELEDTTCYTIRDPNEGWFPDGDYSAKDNEYVITHSDGREVELLFRSCDRPDQIKKFKSLEITGYLIDESIEVSQDIKRMLKNRIGRYPKWSTWCEAFRKKFPELTGMDDDQVKEYVAEHPDQFKFKFGIEITNPPDVEHPTYSEFKWETPPPGPVPKGIPLDDHVGFWQPPRENEPNLTPGYYDDLIAAYRDSPDWAAMYVEGKPGIVIKGKLVYNNFRRNYHVAKEPLIWARGPLYRGWDNSGNCPACVVVQVPTAGRLQVLREFHTDKLNIVDFTKIVVAQCNLDFPGAVWKDWGDPAGANKYSKREGGFTSNAQLMKDECNVVVLPSDQNFIARVNSVDGALARIDGILIDPSCIRLINGFLGGYCYPEIGTTGIYRDEPDKNRFSHPHDALQYICLKLLKSTTEDSEQAQARRRRMAARRNRGTWVTA